MFEALIKVIQNTKKLDENKILREIFNNTSIQQDIIFLNQEQMYEKGIDSKGESLGEYSNFTIGKKIEKGQRYDHVTLKDTGDFYNSMKFKNGKDGFTISANMVKPDTNLETIFPNALGLTDESLQEIKDLVLPRFKEAVLEAIRK